MPIYDCGAPDCMPCEREFGPDRSEAIARYEARDEAYHTERNPHDALIRALERIREIDFVSGGAKAHVAELQRIATEALCDFNDEVSLRGKAR